MTYNTSSKDTCMLSCANVHRKIYMKSRVVVTRGKDLV